MLRRCPARMSPLRRSVVLTAGVGLKTVHGEVLRELELGKGLVHHRKRVAREVANAV